LSWQEHAEMNMMKLQRLVVISVAAGALNDAIAQVAGIDGVPIYSIEAAHYEFDSGGVPLVGLITAAVAADRVKFTTCTNKTIEVDRNRLTKSKANCFRKPKDPGPWTAQSNSIYPIVRAGSGATPWVALDGRNVSLENLVSARSYKYLSAAKVGEVVGVAFTTEDGRKAIAILSEPTP